MRVPLTRRASSLRDCLSLGRNGISTKAVCKDGKQEREKLEQTATYGRRRTVTWEEHKMETYTYPHFPQHISIVHVALFTSVSNAKEIRARIVKASTVEGPDGDAERENVNFAFIDAKLVSTICFMVKLLTSMTNGDLI